MTDTGFKIESELTKIFNLFNQHYWSGNLPEVMITFAPARGNHGHMTGSTVWVSHDDGKYELNVNAHTINRGIDEVCGTVLHEMCHLSNMLKGVADCSNSGRYHNDRFRSEAESHGLTVVRVHNWGWAKTHPNDETKRLIREAGLQDFAYRRIPDKKPGHRLKKYVCPGCGEAFAYVSSPQFMRCGWCNSVMVDKDAC